MGPAADVYALGAILYECLTGRPPFKAPTVLEALSQVVNDDPVPPRRLQSMTPRDLETVCLKCLEKDATRRYSSAEALAEDLRRFQGGEPILARPMGLLGRAAKWARRRPAVAAFMMLFVLTLLTGTGFSMYFAVVASDKAERAKEAQRKTTDALEKTKQEQAKTAEALQKSQERRAVGLLRPVGHSHDPVDPIELGALWELATLPKEEESVRLLFIEQALDRPETAQQLERAAQSPSMPRWAWIVSEGSRC